MTTNIAFPPAHYAVFSNPLAGREAELERWYEDVHIPDSLDAGLFDSVRRYRSCSDTGARFLTLWGCDYPDTDSALTAVRPVAEALRQRGRIEVVQEVVFQEFIFRDGVERDRSTVADVAKGLTTYLSCWAEPESLRGFEATFAPIRSASLAVDGESAVAAMAQYGHRGDRARALVLAEHSHPEEPWGFGDGMESKVAKGLPPFGEPVPIFPGGSPAPSPETSSARPANEAQVEIWAVRWECISVR